MNDEIEEWRPVVGHEGAYEVSSFGRVRSLDRRVPTRRKTGVFGKFYPGGIKTPTKHPVDNYLRVWLYRNGETYPRTVHSLVAEAFLGPYPPGKEVCHNDGNGHNNRRTNLRYDTRPANREDSRAMDRLAVGERIAQHKLTTDEVLAIRAAASSRRSLADRYAVSISQIDRIVTRKNWRHV